MFILHHLLSTLCLVLPVFFSSVSEPPTHAGTLGLGRDGHTSCHDLVAAPCVVLVPRRAPTNDTPPITFNASPPPRPEPSSSRLASLKTGLSEVVTRVALTKRAISYTLCEARPPIICPRAPFAAYEALFRVRVRYRLPYYLAKQLLRPVLAPPMVPSPPPRLPPPPASRTTGDGPPPTRTRTTSASNPAPPMPAYASMKGRSCTYDYEVVSTPSAVLLAPTWVKLHCRLSRALRVLLSLPTIVLVAIQVIVYLPIFFSIMNVLGLNPQSRYPEPTIRRVIHYAYELTIEGHRFQTKNLWYEKRWEDSGPYADRKRMERCAWHDIGCTLRRFEKNYASEPLLGMELRLQRTKTVFDVYEDQTGTHTFAVPQEYHGCETFVNEDHFKFDPDPTYAYIEDPDDVGPDQAGAGGLGGY